MESDTYSRNDAAWLFGLPAVTGGSAVAALSVTDITQHLSALLRQDEILQDVWVRAEISNLTRAASGHLYFTLKDQEACLSCAMWRTYASRLSFRPEPGMQVLARGRIDVYFQRGQYQFIVQELQADGDGALHLAFERLKALLLSEGLLAVDRKRPLPAFPRRVALVTSSAGAALRDMLAIFATSPYPPEIILVPTPVQGEGAEWEIAAALELCVEQSRADVIIVGRGGGSLEDLWCFNTEPVARAIAASPLPVISAVGHEVDFTLADLVADMRAPTPTAAAELVLQQRHALIQAMAQHAAAASTHLQSRLELSRLRLEGLSQRMPLAHPEWMIERRRQLLDDLQGRLLRARDHNLSQWRHRLALAAGQLDSLNPLRTLHRGYATLQKGPNQEPVFSIDQLSEGDAVQIRLADGTASARITSIKEARPNEESNRD